MSQVHEQLVKKSVWGDRLKQVSWRVDVKTKSRHIDQINTPTGIIELQLGKEDNEKVVCVSNTAFLRECDSIYIRAEFS